MYLVPVVVANFGRDETSAEFVAAVLRMIDVIVETMPKKFREDPVKALKRMALGISELDEADKPAEHPLMKRQLDRVVPGWHAIGWGTLNPLVLGPSLKSSAEKTTHMCNGVAHLTPDRQICHGLLRNPDQPKIAAVAGTNHHAPRMDGELRKEIEQCEDVHQDVLRGYNSRSVSGFTVGDWNNSHYPPLLNGIETAVHDRLDYIRFWNAPGGATIDPIGQASFRIGIDKHKGHVAVLAIS